MACSTCPNQHRPLVDKTAGVRQPALGEIGPGWGLGLLLVGSIVLSMLWHSIPTSKEMSK